MLRATLRRQASSARTLLHRVLVTGSGETVQRNGTRSLGHRSSFQSSHRVCVGVALALLFDDITCVDLDGRLDQSVRNRRQQRSYSNLTCNGQHNGLASSFTVLIVQYGVTRGVTWQSPRHSTSLSSFDPLGCHLHPPKHYSSTPHTLLQFVRSSASRPA